MTIVGIPDVVVLEAVHLHVERAVVFEVHVSNEKCAISLLCHHPLNTLRIVSYLGHQSPPT